MNNFSAAIFDLDGTLLDSLGVWSDIDRVFLAKRGIVLTPDYTAAVSTMSFSEAAVYTISRYGFRDTPEEISAEWEHMVEDEYAHRITLKPFAREYLELLHSRGVKMGVATALSERLYRPALENNGITPYFSAYASVFEAARGKGFPDVYLLAAKRLGVLPTECAVFEDVLPGIRGARAAGMETIAVYDAYSAPEESVMRQEADYYIKNFQELL